MLAVCNVATPGFRKHRIYNKGLSMQKQYGIVITLIITVGSRNRRNCSRELAISSDPGRLKIKIASCLLIIFANIPMTWGVKKKMIPDYV